MKCAGRMGAGKLLELSVLENVILLSEWHFALGQVIARTVTRTASRAVERLIRVVPLLRKLPIASFITQNNLPEIWVHERLIHRQNPVYFLFILSLPLLFLL